MSLSLERTCAHEVDTGIAGKPSLYVEEMGASSARGIDGGAVAELQVSPCKTNFMQ